MLELQFDQLATLFAAATLLFYPATIGLRTLREGGVLVLVSTSRSIDRGVEARRPEPTDLDAQWKRIADQIASSLDDSRAMISLQTRARREVDGTEYLLERLFEDVPLVASVCGGRSGHAEIYA
jgi:hypothetical protein